MTELTAQQAAILTEGICPLCEGAIVSTAIERFWHCPQCKKGYELVNADDDKEHRVTEWVCDRCQKANLSVHPATTSCLECSGCQQTTCFHFEHLMP